MLGRLHVDIAGAPLKQTLFVRRHLHSQLAVLHGRLVRLDVVKHVVNATTTAHLQEHRLLQK